MWQALAGGRIDYISSDHAPSTRAQKSGGSIWEVPFGLPGIDTTSAVLLDGAKAGRLTYERVVEVYAEAPARIYGLARKGRLVPGADADVSVVDPAATWTVSDDDILSRSRLESLLRAHPARPANPYVRPRTAGRAPRCGMREPRCGAVRPRPRGPPSNMSGHSTAKTDVPSARNPSFDSSTRTPYHGDAPDLGAVRSEEMTLGAIRGRLTGAGR